MIDKSVKHSPLTIALALADALSSGVSERALLALAFLVQLAQEHPV